MTATEGLRRMLDECGVKYDTAATVISETVATFWYDRDGEPCSALEGADDIPDGKLSVQALLTPAQAIDATLGRGTCENVGYYIDSTRFKCSACGYNGWTKYAADGEDKVPRYCPNCGREVVDE